LKVDGVREISRGDFPAAIVAELGEVDKV
jgi:hypothetical protein